jgi:predicted exporter
LNKNNYHHRLALLWLLIVSALFLHSTYLFLEKRATFNSDILALLPNDQRDPVVQKAVTHTIDTVQQQIVILIGASTWTKAVEAADAYTAVINSHPDLLENSNISTTDIPFKKNQLGLLTSKQRKELQTESPEYWVNLALSNLYNPFGGAQFSSFQEDPFGLFRDWIQTRAQETPVRPRDGKLFVADQNNNFVVLLMHLKKPAFSITTQKEIIPLLKQAEKSAKQKFSQVDIISTGVVLHAAFGSQQASHEMSTIALGSLLGIILLLWMTFNSLKPLLLIGSSIAIGCLGALSLCWILFGQVYLLTLVFGASLIGIAQDYGIYFLCNRLGTEKTISSYQLLKKLYPSLRLMLAAVIVGLSGLALTPFPGLQQMAVFSAVGLVFAWLTVVCWFPLFINSQTLQTTYFTQKFINSLKYWPILKINKATLIIGLLFFMFILMGLSKLRVDDDIRSLQKSPQILINDQIKLSKILDTPAPAQFYIVRGESEELILEREEALKFQLEPLISEKIITGYQAISNWVPSSQIQIANQILIKNKLLYSQGPLEILANKLDENNKWANQIKNNLLNSSMILTPDNFLKTPFSEPWRYLWLGKIEGNYASIVMIKGLNNYQNLSVLQNIAPKVAGVKWVDKINDISSVLRHYRQYMSIIIVAAYLAIYLLLYLRYRHTTWRILMPPVFATISTLAILGLLELPLQLFHVLAFMLILGLGVDYGIFFQEKFNQQEEGYAWLTIGLSAISALLSFGLLGLSQSPPLHAFGITMLIGMTIVWIIAPFFRNPEQSST